MILSGNEAAKKSKKLDKQTNILIAL